MLDNRWEMRLTVKRVVGSLEGHLNVSIGTEAMSGDELLSVSSELESFDVVLTDEITESSLGESNSVLDLK